MNLRTIYSNKKYLGAAVIVSVVTFFALYYLTFSFTTPGGLLSTEGAFYLYFTFISDFLLSILIGFNVLLMLHSTANKAKIAKEGALAGSGGILTGAFASGCPVCGSVLLPLVGVSGGLAVFPLRGLELKALALMLIVASTYILLKSYNKCSSCRN